jgi:hypothetical protein
MVSLPYLYVSIYLSPSLSLLPLPLYPYVPSPPPQVHPHGDNELEFIVGSHRAFFKRRLTASPSERFAKFLLSSCPKTTAEGGCFGLLV